VELEAGVTEILWNLRLNGLS